METQEERGAEFLWQTRCMWFGEEVRPMPQDERADFYRYQARCIIAMLRQEFNGTVEE